MILENEYKPIKKLNDELGELLGIHHIPFRFEAQSSCVAVDGYYHHDFLPVGKLENREYVCDLCGEYAQGIVFDELLANDIDALEMSYENGEDR